MKLNKYLLTLSLAAFVCVFSKAQVGINTTGESPDSSAMLDVQSTDKGMLTPRMTSSQRGAIVDPATGLLVYQTNAPEGFYEFTGLRWVPVGANLTSGKIYGYTSFNTESPDAQQPITASTAWPLNGGRWQSIIAEQTGQMTKVEIRYWEPEPISGPTIRIYEGEGTNGPLLAEETFAGSPAGTTWQTYTFSSPPDVVEGGKYSIYVHDVIGSWRFHPGNPYPGGIASVDPTNDFAFRTHVVGDRFDLLTYDPVTGTTNLANANLILTAAGKIGIGQVPVNHLDVEGRMAIGSAYAGTHSAPANGAIIQGNVGIGTFNPTKGKLVIEGSQTDQPPSFGYLNGNGDTGFFVPQGPMNYSVYASHNISANEFHAHSDRRIKNIKGISDNAADLETLMQIEVTDYRLRDTISHSGKAIKKVIAQQVAEVYPQAVSTHLTEVIPDIYKRASIENDWIMLNTDLQIGERVKIISRDKSDIYAVLDVESDRFKVSGLNLSMDKGELLTVFIYGREVDDFHTVDYEAIAMLNVSATQGLAQLLLDQQKAIAALENKLAALEASLNIVPDRKINVIHDSPITSAASGVQNMPIQ